MKGLIHKKWLSIPVTVFLVLVLTAGAVLASGVIRIDPVDQIITQNINAPHVDDYGSITANPISLPNVVAGAGSQLPQVTANAVTVELGPDGVGKYLCMKLDKVSTDPYIAYLVGIRSGEYSDIIYGENPTGEFLTTAVWVMPAGDKLESSIGPLTVKGTYYFEVSVSATPGDAADTANVVITYTLEDGPVE
ncbi:hypothetical protein ES703_00115 [subsurface metagenome]